MDGWMGGWIWTQSPYVLLVNIWPEGDWCLAAMYSSPPAWVYALPFQLSQPHNTASADTARFLATLTPFSDGSEPDWPVPQQWFSNVSYPASEPLVKHRLLGLPPSFWVCRAGWGPITCTSDTFPSEGSGTSIKNSHHKRSLPGTPTSRNDWDFDSIASYSSSCPPNSAQVAPAVMMTSHYFNNSSSTCLMWNRCSHNSEMYYLHSH